MADQQAQLSVGDSRSHKSMVVSSTGVDGCDASASSSVNIGPSEALQRFVNSPARDKAWNVYRKNCKHMHYLYTELDAMLSAIEGATLSH